MPTLKNRGPLLVDKVRGYFDRLPEWLRGQITIRVEHQKVDAKIDDLDPLALDSELKQEVTDEKLRTNKFLGDGDPGSGNDMTGLPVSHPSQVVLPETGQVADVTETVSNDEIGLVEGPPLQAGNSEQVGPVWVKKEVTASTFDDKVYQLERADLIPQEFRALVPEKTEAHTLDGDATLPSLGSGETSRREQQKKVGVKTVTVQSRDLTSTPVLEGQRIDPQWNGAILDLEQKIVPQGTELVQVFGVTDGSIKPLDGVNALQETWKVNTTPAVFPTTTARKWDSEIQNEVVSYRSIVANGAPYVKGPWDLDQHDKPIDALHMMREVEVPNGLPAAFNTFGTQMVTFPGILYYLNFALVSLATANRKEPQWVAGIRPSVTIPAQVTHVTEFFLSVPATSGIYQWPMTDIIFKGLSYSINLSNVLTDAWSSVGVTYSGDALYGNTVDRFNISRTYPNATEYINNTGTTQPIACVVERYKMWWVRKTTFVVLQ